MYAIYADGALIYDSTLEDYKIGSGTVTLELDKAGSFVFSLYPDHPHYNSFTKLKTVVTVYKSGRIVFRGRVLDDAVDYWNQKTLTCEGELSFLQDSIARPFTFSGTPAELFRQFVELHNSQVDSFKRFRVGSCTVVDPNGRIARENSNYETVLANMTSRLLEDATGGHFHITHGDDGTDEIPTIHYLADFTKVATQPIEFGSNLADFTKTAKAEEMATAIIPLGATVDDGNSDTEDPKLTIAAVNNGVDFVYSPEAVAVYGWIFKVAEWEDVTDAATLKAKAEAHLDTVTRQTITLELTALDLHLLDRSIESYNVCEYVPVITEPHDFNGLLLCNKQTLDLLNPASDSVVLGETFATFTERTRKVSAAALNVAKIQSTVSKTVAQVAGLNESVTVINQNLSILADKVVYNGVSGYVLASFTLGALTFSSGVATVDAAPYIPEGFELLNCFVQAATLSKAAIVSASVAGNTVTVNARTNVANDTKYTGAAGAVHFMGICQKKVEAVSE